MVKATRMKNTSAYQRSIFDAVFNPEFSKIKRDNPLLKAYDNRLLAVLKLKGLGADIGCGEGTFTSRIDKRRTKVIGIDFAPKAVQTAHAFGLKRCIVGDALNLPLKASCLDFIICHDTLHHITNYRRVINECERVVKNGGRIIISEPNILNFGTFLFSLLNPHERGSFKFHPFGISRILKRFHYQIKYNEFFPRMSIIRKFGGYRLSVLDKLICQTPLKYMASRMTFICVKSRLTEKSEQRWSSSK